MSWQCPSVCPFVYHYSGFPGNNLFCRAQSEQALNTYNPGMDITWDGQRSGSQ